MKINLGSCDNLLDPPWLNIDRHDFARPGYEFRQMDLNRPWGFADSSVDELRAHDIFEHLWPTATLPIAAEYMATLAAEYMATLEIRRTDVQPKIWVMNEAHRVLKPGGVLSLIVPTTDGRGAFQDPTHVTWWTPNDMFYFCVHWLEWSRFAEAYGITAQFRVMTNGLYRATEGWPQYESRACTSRDEAWQAVLHGHTSVANDVTKLHVMLEAVK